MLSNGNSGRHKDYHSSDEESIELIDEHDGTNLSSRVHSLSLLDDAKQEILMDSTNSITFSSSWDFGENVVLPENSAPKQDMLTAQQSTETIESKPVAAVETSINLKSFSSEDGEEYIKQKRLKPKRVDQLTVSARIKCENIELKLHNEGCLLTADDNFIAKVKLEAPQAFDEANDFAEAKAILLEQLRIIEVFSNFPDTRRAETRAKFLEKIDRDMEHLDSCACDYINNYFQLFNITKRLEAGNNINFLSVGGEVIKNSIISDDWKKCAKELYDIELETLTTEKTYSLFGYTVEDESLIHSEIFKEIGQKVSERHKKKMITIFDNAPHYLKHRITIMCPIRMFFIGSNDMELFVRLTTYLRKDIFQRPTAHLFIRWMKKINSLKILEDSRIIPSTNAVFYDLCECLEDIITAMEHTAKMYEPEWIICSKNGWQPIEEEPWEYGMATSEVLQREYLFLFKLLQHFEPPAERVPFQYTIQVLNKPEYEQTWKNIGPQPERESTNPFGLQDRIFVWLCLLDDILAYILPNNNFESIIQSFIRLFGSSYLNISSKIRLIILIAEISPFLFEKNIPSEDKNLLQKQLLLIESIVSEGVANCALHFINVIGSYWKHRIAIISRIPCKIRLFAMGTIQEQLLKIILLASEKNVNPENVKVFHQIFNRLLIDIDKVQFDWFIKSIPTINMDALCGLEIIKQEADDQQTYRVVQPSKFDATFPLLFPNVAIPKHYVIEIISTLLSRIQDQLQREKWQLGDSLTPEHQLKTAGELVHTIRLTLPQLRTPISDNSMFEVMVAPISEAVGSASSHKDFSDRMKHHRLTVHSLKE